MKKRSLMFVMFVLVQMVAAGLMFADDGRAGAGNRRGEVANTAGGGPMATSITPGGPVKSEDNGSHGRRHTAAPPKTEPELQFEGTIKAASATSITVHDSHGADVVVALTSTTVIRKGDATIAAADLKVGDQVHVKATSANNVNTAVQVVVQTADQHELEIEGTIKAASATSITVHDSHGADVVVALTSTTIIRKGDATIAAADLKVGDQVHVKATSLNNVNTAVQVVVQVEDDQHSIEVEGTITVASATSITIHDAHGTDVILMLTASTVIRKGNLTIAAGDLKAGDHVEAEAIAQGIVNTAIVIHVDVSNDGEHGGATASVAGTVTAVSGTQFTVRTEDHGEVIVKTDASTVVRKQGNTIAVSDIHTGNAVTCSGTVAADHSLLAKQIEVHDSSGHH
jgi:hypothetical protein